MKAEKRTRLEGAGWRVGSTSDFLDLSEAEAALVEMKIKLGDLARTTRIRRRISQEKLALWLSSSQSRVSKIERGHASVSLDLAIRTLLILGVTAGAMAAVIGRSASRVPHADPTTRRSHSSKQVRDKASTRASIPTRERVHA